MLVHPLSDVTVRVISYKAGAVGASLLKQNSKLCELPVIVPFATDQCHCVLLPDARSDESLNAIHSGSHPETGLPAKLTVGLGLMEMIFVMESAHPKPETTFSSTL